MGSLRVPRRFNGPPDSGHGGYCCGVIAGLLGQPAIAELQAPPPLEVTMAVVETGEGLEVRDGERLVARAWPAPQPTVVPPATVAPDSAAQAVEGYQGFVEHPFPTCFVCGPQRAAGDGLRIFPGPVEGAGMVAAPWRPASGLAGVDGAVAPAFVWSVLDCPALFGFNAWALRAGRRAEVAVLARMRIRHDAPVPVGEELVVLGWGVDADGRKLHAGSAIQAADGAILASADTLWIRLKDQPQARAR